MKPALVPGAFVRTYVGEVGRTWVLIFGMPARRVRLDLTDRVLCDHADGRRDILELAELASERLQRPVGAAEVDDRIGRLVGLRGMVAGDQLTMVEPQINNLVSRPLDAAAAALLSVVTSGARTGCHMRGGCCRLYDRIGLTPEDAANVREAFAEDELTPGGLSLETALRADGFGGHDELAVAVVDGGGVLLDAEEKCTVHARLGIDKKPAGCRQYPLRDVAVGNELHVGLAVECRCILDFAETGEPLDTRELLTRRRFIGEVEEVARTVGVSSRVRWPRPDYLAWRERALAALPGEPDLVVWALREAAVAAGAPGGPPELVLRSMSPVIADLARYFRNQARDISEVYSANDLELELFGWAAEAMAILDDRTHPASSPDVILSPLPGERFYVEQLVFSHNLLRSKTLTTALGGLAIRLAAARVGAGMRLDPRLHQLSAMEVLFRAHGAGYLVDTDAHESERALGLPEPEQETT